MMFLLGIVAPGKIGLFGGHREGNETFLECVVREVQEETGLALPREMAVGKRARRTSAPLSGKLRSQYQSIRQKPDGLLPDLLANEEAPLDLRFQAAKELAPFVHPKLASTESRPGGMSHEDRLEQLRELLSDDD
jgi:8-oxo-dGTP pyrophosphatase MutT (NUDIX family)